MKGIVFTEFLDMVDQKFSPEICETMIMGCELESGGAYTAVGTYSHKELISMVVELHKITEIPIPDLVKTFGAHLFQVFSKGTLIKFDIQQDYFDFLDSIENVIHVEVRKLYPDASIPSLECHQVAPKQLKVHYSSRCPFADLAEGLIQESAKFFETPIDIDRTDIGDEGNNATFVITKVAK